MSTMYDRLGELLNETLEAGEVRFVRMENPVQEESNTVVEEEKTFAEAKADEIIDSIKKSRARRIIEQQEEYQTVEATIYKSGTAHNINISSYSPNNFIYKKITPDIERACRLLELEQNFSEDEIKKAYKQKLKYYHPDRYEGNAVLQKVASDKTQQIVNAYHLLLDFVK